MFYCINFMIDITVKEYILHKAMGLDIPINPYKFCLFIPSCLYTLKFYMSRSINNNKKNKIIKTFI